MPALAPHALSGAEVALVFGLSVSGYGLLTCLVASWGLSWRGVARHVRPIAWTAWALLVAHVALIWGLRFGWSFEVSVRNGYAGWIPFHAAFAVVLVALPWLRALHGRRAAAVVVAWVLVTPGVVAAPFRYPFIAGLAPVVLALGAWGTLGLAVRLRRWKVRSGR